MRSNRISVLLVASVLLTVTSAVITHYAIRQGQDRVNWVAHTHLVIKKSGELLALLKDAENSQRGYLITSDSAYLNAFFDAEEKIPSITDSLQQMVADKPEQQQLIR